MGKKKKIQVVIGVIAVLVCGVIYITVNNRQPVKEEVVTEQFADGSDSGRAQPASAKEAGKTPQKGDNVYIHICGEVKKPGVYVFSDAPRLVEVVKHAGGFTKKADTSAVNQAESVTDGSQITIPAKQSKRSVERTRDSTTKGKVNINTASREELMTLNGIGESKASQIISYRETNGAFEKIDDIMNITGIKEGVFSKIKENIIVS